MNHPTAYSHADRLGYDGAACLNFARLTWNGLSDTMRLWLKEAHIRGRIPLRTPARTQEALRSRGIIEPGGSRWLTALGELVREAGVEVAP